MSSTDDSGINAKTKPTPGSSARDSPRVFTKRIGYAVTPGARPSRIKAGGEAGLKGPKDLAGWKFPSVGCTKEAGCRCNVCCGDAGAGASGRMKLKEKTSRRGCVVFIVFVALLLDSLLLTCMVPIIPNYLRDLESRKAEHQPGMPTTTTVSPLPRNKEHREGNSTSSKMTDDCESGDCTVMEAETRLPQANSSGYSGYSSRENTRISLLFASKTMVQVVANLLVGPLTERIGYTAPMFSGFIVLLVSTIASAFGNSFKILFAARAFQGVGTALSTTSGMGLLASLYPDQTERAVAQTKAFSGLALGVFLGPPYGGVLYELLGGKEIPCLILAAMALFEGVLQLCVMRPRIEREPVAGASLIKLLMDPYIIITAAAITVSNLGTAVLEPALPIWMYYTMNAETWLQGIAFVPSTVSYLLFLQVFGVVASKLMCFKVSQRWSCTIFGMTVIAVSISFVPYCPSFFILIAPLLLMGFGLANVCTCMLPHIGALVDHRYQRGVYGSAYAITDNAFCLAFALGPAISGPLIDTVGFTWTMRGVGVIILMFVPLVLFLRNPPGRSAEYKQADEEKVNLVSDSTPEPFPTDYSSCKTTSMSEQ